MAEAALKYCKFHELHPFGPWQLGYAFLQYHAEILMHRYQLQAKRTGIFWRTTYRMFIGSGLYKTAMAIDHTPLVRSTRIARYLLVYGSWQLGLDNSSPLVHLREKGVVVTSKPFTCIEGKAGLVVVRCEYVLPSKSNVQQLSSASMVPRRQPADWLCIEVL